MYMYNDYKFLNAVVHRIHTGGGGGLIRTNVRCPSTWHVITVTMSALIKIIPSHVIRNVHAYLAHHISSTQPGHEHTCVHKYYTHNY